MSARLLCLCLLWSGGPLRADDAPQPVTGPPTPATAAYDRIVPALMARWSIPGGAVAVTRAGRLVLARGYGWSDAARQAPVTPAALFRIASLSKPVTSAAVLVLVEQGTLGLDDRLGDVLPPAEFTAQPPADARWTTITLRQLLQHTAGFDREASFDPMFRAIEIARASGSEPPAYPRQIVRYMLGRPLDFDPGTRYAYSNFGYCLLGRVIERATGRNYESAVRALVLAPAGCQAMRLGRSLPAERAEGEVCYHDPAGDAAAESVFASPSGRVSWPYGGFALEAMDAHGGWLASAVDLVRFASAVDGSRSPALLRPATRGLVAADAGFRFTPGQPAYYGLGWAIHPTPAGTNWSHSGSLPGTMALLVRTHHGMTWAALFNLRPDDAEGFLGQLDRALWQAFQETATWPEEDLFAAF